MNRRSIAKTTRVLLFTIFPLIVIVLVVEVVVRVSGFNVSRNDARFPINNDITMFDIYDLDHDLFWKFKPNRDIWSITFGGVSYRINSIGLRGEEPRTDADIRVLALGNSCTFGWSVKEQYMWTTALEQSLSSRSPSRQYDVINAGVPGYTSFQGIRLASKLLRQFQSQYVLIMYGWNDHWTAGSAGCDADIDMPHPSVLSLINALSPLQSFQKLRTYMNESSRDDSVTINTVTGTRRVSPEQFRDNLSALIDTTLQYGAVPILLVPPIAPPSATSGELQHLHREYEQIIRDVASRRSAFCVDLQRAFDSSGNLFTDSKDPVHFGVEGHALIAKTVKDAIEAIESAHTPH